ncbi:large tegument protein [Murid herpesvirus 3]|uniref:Large tegument protein n=2 Tax=Murid betaherpesvirus 3 TaxID=2560603 RepID=A0A1P8VIV0_9BETA|nr:large tegument protein [Murine roseolovirus]APZ76257.1 large tegument protein [Murid betaherpesvirus 3]AYH64706.1 large tegument protein [Murid herpesvirus 3]
MKIISGSTNQTDTKYGERAGNQCVSNCFVYLHTVYLNGIKNVLNKKTIDQILDNGSNLDQKTYTRISTQNGKIAQFRLPSEIDKTITTPHGTTYHELSRAFNGTFETQIIDNVTYFGISDFLEYAYEKKPPPFIIITVGAITRGIFILDKFYVFDPHSTPLENNAAIYECDNINEVYVLLSGNIQEGFYFEAIFIFFLDLTDLSITTNQATSLIFTTYKDIDISLTSNRYQSTPSKRKSKNAVPIDNKRSKTHYENATNIVQMSALELVPSLFEFKSKIEDKIKEIPNELLLQDKNTWSIKCINKLKIEDFSNYIIWRRIMQLFGQCCDAFLYTETTSEQNMMLAKKWFTPFCNFRPDLFTERIGIFFNNNFCLVDIYKNYISKLSVIHKLDTYTIGKCHTAFSTYIEKHSEYCLKWVTSLTENINMDLDNINKSIEDYININPFELNVDFVCFLNHHKYKIFLLVDNKVKEIQSLKQKDSDTTREIITYITSDATTVNINDQDTLNKSETHNVPIPEYNKQNINFETDCLSKKSMNNLKTFANERFTNICKELENNLIECIKTNFNNIAVGFLPISDLNRLFLSVINIDNKIENLAVHKLIDKQFIKLIEQLQDNIFYIRFGNVNFSMDHVFPTVTKARQNYISFHINNVNTNQRAKELINNIETILITDQPSQISKEMIQKQLEQLDIMDMEPQLVEKTNTLKTQLSQSTDNKEVHDFINNIFSTNIPSIQQINSIENLKTLLQEDEKTQQLLYSKLQNLLSKYVSDLYSDVPIQSSTLDPIIYMMEFLPKHGSHKNFAIAVQVLNKLIKYKSFQKTTPEDELKFLHDHKDDIKILSDEFFGHDIIYYNRRLENTVRQNQLLRAEKEWVEVAKTIHITDQDELTKFIQTAPTENAYNIWKPKLEIKLKQFLDQKQQEIEKLKKLTNEENKKSLEQMLAQIIILIKEYQFSLLPQINLQLCQKLYNDLQTPEIILSFLQTLIPILDKLRTEVHKCINDMVENILLDFNVPQNTLNDVQRLSSNELAIFLNNFMSTAFCSEDMKSGLSILMQKIQQCSAIIANPKISIQDLFPHDAKKYKKDIDTYKKDLENIKKSLSTEFENKKSFINTNPKKYADKDVYIQDQPIYKLKPKQTFFREIAFMTAMTKYIEINNNKINELILHYNLHLKTALQHITTINTSFEHKWNDFLAKQKLKINIDINLQDLKIKPLEYITKCVTESENDIYTISFKKLQILHTLSTGIRNFCEQVIKEVGASIIPFEYIPFPQLISKIQSLLEETKIKIVYNEQLLETKKVETIKIILSKLDPKRIIGGIEKYNELMNYIKQYEENIIKSETQGKLIKAYIKILEDVTFFKYGLDFNKQLKNIEHLYKKFQDIKTDKSFEEFPNVERVYNSVTFNPKNYMQGLIVLKLYTMSALTYAQNFFLKQPRVFVKDEYINPDLSMYTYKPKQDINIRLRLSDPNTTWYKIDSIFKTSLIVNEKGIPIQFTDIYKNPIFKFFALNYEHINIPKNKPRYNSEKFKRISICKIMCSFIKQNWENIFLYDLSNHIQNKPIVYNNDNILTINFKIISFVFNQVWQYIQSKSDSNTITLTLEKFTVFLTALHPQYITGIMSNNIDLSINILAKTINIDEEFMKFNVYINPPSMPIDQLPGFCINKKIWRSITFKNALWDHDFFTQTCGQHPKLFVYLMAYLVLPRKLLNILWDQFKPITYPHEFFETFITDLCVEYIHKNKLKMEDVNPRSKTNLETGERITNIYKVETNVHMNNSLLHTFNSQNLIFDYLIFSYLTGMEMTFCMYVDNLTDDHILLLRHIENTKNNPKFMSVLQKRNFDIMFILKESWTHNIVEHSLFTSQLQKMINAFISFQDNPPQIPLILYDDKNIIHSMYLPPENSPSQMTTFNVNTNYPIIPLKEHPSPNIIPFNNTPYNIDFLYSSPPKMTPMPDISSQEHIENELIEAAAQTDTLNKSTEQAPQPNENILGTIHRARQRFAVMTDTVNDAMQKFKNVQL